MNDFAYVAILLAFFAVSVLLVFGCDRIIGSDEEALALSGDEPEGKDSELELVAK